MELTIIKNAPPPPSRETRGRKPYGGGDKRPVRARYPFHAMEVGDAFDVPITSVRNIDMRYPEYNRLTAAITSFHKRYPGGKRFTARMLENEFKARCWRIA